ncbi:encapsulin [Sulfolobus tengchongensis]|uniref:Encapsulin n=1 Tax=Sulfolobus tengchongensis TaxID=207809 RepID=A0AAX4KWC3_9CREN
MAHFGEFLRLLYQVSPEDFSYFRKGWEEASKLIGQNEKFPLESPPSKSVETTKEDPIVNWIIEGIVANRVVRNIGNAIKYDSTMIPYSEIKVESDELIQSKNISVYEVPLISFQVKFYLGQKGDARRISLSAGNSFVKIENKLLLKNHPLSPFKIGSQLRASDWNQTGNILADVLRAYEILSKGGFGKDVYILLSPLNYSRTFRVVDKAGTYEIELLKDLGNVIPINDVEDDEIYVISKLGFDILLYSDVAVEYLSKEKDYDVYLISEQIAPRLVSNSAACVIKS